jgi:hypothetical protein
MKRMDCLMLAASLARTRRNCVLVLNIALQESISVIKMSGLLNTVFKNFASAYKKSLGNRLRAYGNIFSVGLFILGIFFLQVLEHYLFRPKVR